MRMRVKYFEKEAGHSELRMAESLGVERALTPASSGVPTSGYHTPDIASECP